MDFLGSLVQRERCAFVSGWWAARCRPCSTAHNKQIKLILKKMLGLKYPTQHTKYVLASKSTFSSSHLTSSVFSSVITSICPVFNVDQVLYARGRGGHVLRKPRGQVKRLPWTSKVWSPFKVRDCRETNRLQGKKQRALGRLIFSVCLLDLIISLSQATVFLICVTGVGLVLISFHEGVRNSSPSRF